MKNGLENFKYKEYGHYELREVCTYIICYVISSHKLKFNLLKNISHAISAANEDQCETTLQVWQNVAFLHFQVQIGPFSGFWFTGESAQLKTPVIEYLLNALRFYQEKKRFFSEI